MLCPLNASFWIQKNLRNLTSSEWRENYRALNLPSFLETSCYSYLNDTLSCFAIRGSLHQLSPFGMYAPHALPSSPILVPLDAIWYLNHQSDDKCGQYSCTTTSEMTKYYKKTALKVICDTETSLMDWCENKRKERQGQVEIDGHSNRCLQHLVERQEERSEAAGAACKWRGLKREWLIPIVCMIFKYSLELTNYWSYTKFLLLNEPFFCFLQVHCQCLITYGVLPDTLPKMRWCYNCPSWQNETQTGKVRF